uniref:G_PROTEIN_RECEP_F1_2 domain-containing protein n=1 Tax=Meloidogyne hapla TaxID=6305 RepID=A0A1I8BYZ5_MELHA
MSDVLDINAYNNSENDASYKVASSSILILSEQPQLQEQNQVKSCHEMETLFSGLNNFFRDEDILKESEHSSELLLLSKEAYTGGVIILQYLLPLASIAFAYSRIARRMGARKSCRCGSGGGVDSRKNSVYLNTPVFSNRSSLCRQIAAGGATSPFSASDNGHQNSKLVIFTNDETNCNLLQNVNPSAEILLNQRRKSIAVRHRRTNMLLVTLVVVFACAWLPLNIFHAHLTAMCSACLNPCCYAFFNNNFRQEFIAMYRKLGLITFYRRLVNFTKILRPNSEINKNGSVNATQINRNKELGTTPSTENEENQHLQQMTQGVLKNSEETSSRPLYEALNEKMVKIPKLEPCESGRRERKVSILAETIRMNCY